MRRSARFPSWSTDSTRGWSTRATCLLRLASAGGLLATLALLALGTVWPSLFTIMAIFAVASPFLFLANIVRPAFLREWHGLRGYAVLCVFLSAIAWTIEIGWLAFYTS